MRQSLCVLWMLLAVAVGGDFADDFQAALRLQHQGRADQACARFTELADVAPTPGSRSDSLRQAFLCAISTKAFGNAQELLARIPREGTKRLCEMDLLFAQGKARELVDRFGEEDLTEWPDCHVFDALVTRGRAYGRLGQYAAAIRDFTAAEAFATTPAKLARVLNLSGSVLVASGDDVRALAVFRRMEGIASMKGYGMINDAVVSAARILSRQGKHDEALREMEKIPPKDDAHWRTRPLVVRAEILAAQGKKAEARAAYVEALRVAPENQRQGIQAAMEELK